MVGQSRVEEGILILIQIELSSRVRSNKDKCVYAVNVTVRSATYITNTLVRKLVSEKNVFISPALCHRHEVEIGKTGRETSMSFFLILCFLR